MHRLLNRQIKQHFPSFESLPIEVKDFMNVINKTYEDYDNDIDHLEHILKMSSQELFSANKKLSDINKQNLDVISQKTRSLKKNQFILESAEKIAGFCALSINLASNEVEVTSQFKTFFPIFSNTNEFDLKLFFNQFDDSQNILQSIKAAVDGEASVNFQNIYNSSIAKYFDLDCEILKGIDENKYLLIVLKDFTQRKLIENERENYLLTLNNYIKAIDAAAIVSVTDEKGVINYINDNFCETSQYSQKELIGKIHNIVNSGHHPKEYFQELWRTISNGNVWKGVINNKKKDQTCYWVDSTIVPFSRNGKIYQFFSICFDVTEKMNAFLKLNEQKIFYETILNNIPVDIAVFNNLHKYLFVNPVAIKNPQTREFLIGKDDFDYCLEYGKDKIVAVKRRDIFEEVKKTGKPLEFTDNHTNKDGKSIHILRRFFPIFKNTKDLEYMIGIGIDITERIISAKKIQESLEEKESLLGEIHHRVKNNLALIIGLIEMQSQRTEDPVLKNELQIILRRINAIGLIHQKLYQSNNFAKINICEYLNEFAIMSFKFLNNNSTAKFKLECENVYLNTKQAIPVSLIFNELLSNYFKYAVNGVKDPLMKLIITVSDNVVRFNFSDNGPGLPANFDVSKTKTLGSKLIILFLKQLKAKYEIVGENGFFLKFEFEIAT